MGCNFGVVLHAEWELVFQYPLRVEVGCNVVSRISEVVNDQVSVPSTGRSGLQLQPLSARHEYGQSFSTLYGSKWVATTNSLIRCLKRYWFQYPLRVEVGCNNMSAWLRGIDQAFQYPLRVEVGCNPVVGPTNVCE